MPPLDRSKTEISSSNKKHTSQYKPKENHPTTYNGSPAFKGPLVLERSSLESTSLHHARLSHYFRAGNLPAVSPTTPRVTLGTLDPKAPTKARLARIVQHLAKCDAPVDVKEVAESIEFLLVTRKRLVGAVKSSSSNNNEKPTITLLDACAGHGLTGLLFAACHANVHTVCLDQTKPPAHDVLHDLLLEICPWMCVTYQTVTLQEYASRADHSAQTPLCVIATHACGNLTDQVLDLAIHHKAHAVAVLPCCYTGTASNNNMVPYGVKRALGVGWAADVRRAFLLQQSEYSYVDFAAIPEEITPMNRILIATR